MTVISPHRWLLFNELSGFRPDRAVRTPAWNPALREFADPAFHLLIKEGAKAKERFEAGN
jgi:hypothetical protein